MKVLLALATVLAAFASSSRAAGKEEAGAQPDRWTLAQRTGDTHRFSTLFTAQDVRRYLSSESGLQDAISWCKQTGVTKVYIETFRDAYQAERAALSTAREAFRSAGFIVSGCVTTTKVGKPSTRWKESISCYTDKPTQDKLQSIFEYAAGFFDEIMIDDFWFTDCACAECEAARKAKLVTIGEEKFPVSGDAWEDYRCELMVRLSRERVLGPAKRVNPGVKLIIKYPQWYEQFQERGYEVLRETADFDRIWVGTETRDYQDQRWGGTPQYEAYFIMRWLGGIGGAKCGGGWFDPLGTTPHTYLEQARQTILAGARESMLFCYGALQRDSGPRNVEELRANLPELLSVARQVARRKPLGIATYKPAHSHAEKEPRVFDFVGMIGLPLVPDHEFPTNAPAAFFSIHALKDPDFSAKLESFLKAGKPVLLSDGLENALANGTKLDASKAAVLPVKGEPKLLLQLGQKEIDEIRAPLLQPLKITFHAPNRVALYLFTDGSQVIENFNDESVEVDFNGKKMSVPARGWHCEWK